MLFKKRLLIIAIVFVFFTFFSIAHFIEAVELGGLEKTAEEMEYSPNIYEYVSAEEAIANEIGIIIYAILTLLGIIFMVIVWIGALVIIGSNGNEEEIKKGRNWIKNGFMGMIVVFVAYLFTKVVLLLVSGESLGRIFKI